MWKRCAELFRRRHLDEDLDHEIGLHLAMLQEEFQRGGMSAKEAEAAARREFGGVVQTKERYRDERGLPWLETFAKDVRYALRGLRASPGFTVAAVLSLALGIGANTAIFSLFHALLLRTLPVPNPSELVLLHVGSGGAGFASNDLYWQLARRSDLFSGVLARSGSGMVALRRERGGREESVRNETVSGNYFNVLGVKPALGRFFTESETRGGEGQQLAVLSYDLWLNRFGADPDILGRVLDISPKPLTVIGVAPPGFSGIAVEARTQLWRPAKITTGHNISWLFLMARRRSEVSQKKLQSALDVVMQQYVTDAWGSQPNSAWKRKALEERIEVRDGGIGLSFLREQFAGPLRVLMAAVGLVLLATCTNLAHLLLARGAARRREIAIRLALGAARGRLVRLALTESVLLAAFGSALGVALAFWGERYILLFVPVERLGTLNVLPDASVMAFAVAISAAAVLAFGLAPALRSTAVDPVAGLRSGSSAQMGRPALRRALVTAQVAFSVVLVALAGLFSHSLAQLRAVDMGFHNHDVLTFWLNYPRGWKDAQISAAHERFLRDASAIPGVVSVSYSAPDLLQGRSWGDTVLVPGSDRTVNEPGKVFLASVGPRYLETLGVRPLLGREFDRRDTASSPKVAMVNEAFVREFLAGEKNPLTRMLALGQESKAKITREIAGVVRDIAHEGVRSKAQPTVYMPDSQIENPFGGPAYLLRAALPESAIVPALRKTLDKLAPDMWRTDARTVRQRIDESIFPERMLAVLSSFFGALALFLAAIGLYGVVAYGTARRAGEISLRMALGAEKGDVLWMVLQDALVLVAAGLAIGLPCAFAAGRLTASILFGIQPGDPAALVSTACALVIAGLAAAFVPAQRASAMDPMRALRHE
jgi:predicted permease